MRSYYFQILNESTVYVREIKENEFLTFNQIALFEKFINLNKYMHHLIVERFLVVLVTYTFLSPHRFSIT